MKCDQSAPLISMSGRTAAISSRGVSSSKSVTASTASSAQRQFDAIGLRNQRARRTFQPLHAGIGVQCENENVAERARLFQQTDMPGMQDVVAAVGEDDGLAGTFSIAAALRPVLRGCKRHPLLYTVPIIEGEFRRILVRATNWVGDAVMSLPALQALRQRFSAIAYRRAGAPVGRRYLCTREFRRRSDPVHSPRGWKDLAGKWRIAHGSAGAAIRYCDSAAERVRGRGAGMAGRNPDGASVMRAMGEDFC